MNVAMLLEMAADGFGERVAVGSRDYGWSFADVRRHAVAVAGRLASASTGTLALLRPNGPAVPAALFGAAWAGCTYAPVNYRLPAAALEELLARLQPALVMHELDDVPAKASGPFPPFPDEPATPAVLLFTSGTSATPKAAVLDHANLVSYVLNTVEFGSAGEDEATLLAVPPFHIAGLAAVLTSNYAGRRVVPLASFSAEAWLDVAGREAVTHAFVVPTMLSRIVAVMEADDEARVPTLRTLSYGGARMPLPVLERALRLFPDAGFVNAYGLTETSSTVCVLGPDDHRTAATSADPAVRRRLGSAGRALPGVELAVVDGEIRVRGAQVAGKYADQPSRLADGWLLTGDRGWIDDDGYLYVEGRGDDVIIRGGENISPAEVEDALLRHESVTAAAVVGVTDEEWGERVGAMVVLRPRAQVTPDELAGFARELLGSLKAPEIVRVRDELPLTPTGKVLRRQVRAELEQS